MPLSLNPLFCCLPSAVRKELLVCWQNLKIILSGAQENFQLDWAGYKQSRGHQQIRERFIFHTYGSRVRMAVFPHQQRLYLTTWGIFISFTKGLSCMKINLNISQQLQTRLSKCNNANTWHSYGVSCSTCLNMPRQNCKGQFVSCAVALLPQNQN